MYGGVPVASHYVCDVGEMGNDVERGRRSQAPTLQRRGGIAASPLAAADVPGIRWNVAETAAVGFSRANRHGGRTRKDESYGP
jgi:hypothetical protein